MAAPSRVTTASETDSIFAGFTDEMTTSWLTNQTDRTMTMAQPYVSFPPIADVLGKHRSERVAMRAETL